MSHVHVSFETPEYTANADGLGTLRILEKSLSPREADIVNAYFGLDGENGVTIEQIGQKYDL
jgi:GDP-D-mannose dehydratase